VHLFVSCIFSCISILFVPKSDRSTSTGEIWGELLPLMEWQLMPVAPNPPQISAI